MFALAGMLLILIWSVLEAFDNVVYSNWWRQNIHFFTPVIPVAFSLKAVIRHERKVLSFLVLISLALHYFFLYTMWTIGLAANEVFRLL